MQEFTDLVDQLIGRNGQERTYLNLHDELQKISGGDFSQFRREDIDALWDDDEICAWISNSGFGPIGRLYMGHQLEWTHCHQLMSEHPPSVEQVLAKRKSPNNWTRIYSIMIWQEEEAIHCTGEGDMNLLAELIVDPDVDVQVQALSQIGGDVSAEAIIQVVEDHITTKGRDESIEWLFHWLKKFNEGDFTTEEENPDDALWHIHGQEVWTAVAIYFKENLGDKLKGSDSSKELKFEVKPSKTFFGLDKGNSHCFTAPKAINEFAINTFGLGEGNLQADVKFEIDGELYPATIRLVRINRSKPYKLRADDLEAREVIQFQWKKYPITQRKLKLVTKPSDKSQNQAKENMLNFNYKDNNIFSITTPSGKNITNYRLSSPVMENILKLMIIPGHQKEDLLSWFWISYEDAYEPTLLCDYTQQKGRVILSGAEMASKIDAMSTVPFIKETGKNTQELADTLRNDEDEWQRELSFTRAAKIGEWWRADGSQMLNPVVLKLANNINPFAIKSDTYKCKTTGQERTLQPIKFNTWQVERCQFCRETFNDIISQNQTYRRLIENHCNANGITYNPNAHIWSDQCMNIEANCYGKSQRHKRPLIISDGQHRVRGSQHPNSRGKENEKILFTMMPPDPGSRPRNLGFTDEDSGQIFTDINVRAMGLVPNHKLNMAWRFQMEKVWIWKLDEEFDFRQNTRAYNTYEAILEIAGGSNIHGNDIADNPFYGKIYTMQDDDHNDDNTLVKLSTLFNDHMLPLTKQNPQGHDMPWAGQNARQIGRHIVDYATSIRRTWAGKTAMKDGVVQPIWAPNFDPLGNPLQDERSPANEFWGILTKRKGPKTGQTGGFENLMELYTEFCWVKNTATSFAGIPTQADLDNMLADLDELQWNWYTSGEGFRPWVVDFCRDIIRSKVSGARQSIILDEISKDKGLLTRLNIPSPPDLNDLIVSSVWITHPYATSKGKKIVLPEYHLNALYDENQKQIQHLPELDGNSELHFIQPFNSWGYYTITSTFNDISITLLNVQKGTRRMLHKKAPNNNSEEGMHNIVVQEILNLFGQQKQNPSVGDEILINIKAKNPHLEDSIRNFKFKLK